MALSRRFLARRGGAGAGSKAAGRRGVTKMPCGGGSEVFVWLGGQIAQAQSQTRAVERQLEQVGRWFVGPEMVEILKLKPVWSARICMDSRLNVVHLLAAGIPHVADETGETPLFQAASYGYEGIVRTLLQSGAPIDVQTNSGWTPLHGACHLGHIQVVQALLEAGADKELAVDQGRRPLHLAAEHDHLKLLRLAGRWW